MNPQGDLFAQPSAPPSPVCASGWWCAAFVDPDTRKWRAVSDLRRFDSRSSCEADTAIHVQPRYAQVLHAVPIEQVGEIASPDIVSRSGRSHGAAVPEAERSGVEGHQEIQSGS